MVGDDDRQGGYEVTKIIFYIKSRLWVFTRSLIITFDELSLIVFPHANTGDL